MTAIENIALIFAIIIILKMLVLLVLPKWKTKAINWWSKNIPVLLIVYIVVALIIGKFILPLGAANIAAVMFFTACLYGLTLMSVEPKATIKLAKDMMQKSALKKAWIMIVVWLIIAIAVLVALYS